MKFKSFRQFNVTLIFAILLGLTTTMTIMPAHSQHSELIQLVPQAEAQVLTDENVESTEPAPAEETLDGFVNKAAEVIKSAHAETKKEGATAVTITLIVILAIAQLLVQATKLPLFFKIFTKVGDAGKLSIVAVCTVVTTAVPMLLAGVGWAATLMSGAVLSAIMVAGHQVFKSVKQ